MWTGLVPVLFVFWHAPPYCPAPVCSTRNAACNYLPVATVTWWRVMCLCFLFSDMPRPADPPPFAVLEMRLVITSQLRQLCGKINNLVMCLCFLFCVFLTLSYPEGSWSVVELTPSTSLSVCPGEQVVIKCTASTSATFIEWLVKLAAQNREIIHLPF